MRYLSLLILATLLATPAHAADILIVQSHSNQQFDQTVRQIQTSCGKKSQTYVMGDYAEFDLGRIVREEQPRVVIAVGDRPLKEAQKLRSSSVLYAMSLSPDESRLRDNITGVTMHASAELYLKLFRKLGLRRVGIVYSKAKSGAYIQRAQKIASAYGIELVATEVKAPTSVESALEGLKKSRIDAIWMIPDTTAVTTETLNAYFVHAQQANIPLISFSRAYLAKGAIAALEASRKRMTDQLCTTLTQLLQGSNPAAFPVADIAEASLHTNETVAARLGISLSGVNQLFSSDR